jgi:ribokinase
MNSILVIGSLNADLVIRIPRYPQAGETLQGSDLLTFPGGKGANQAVAAARLGERVTLVGHVGQDSLGDFLLAQLEANSVETSHIRRDPTATGTAIILVEENGQNRIVLSPGANANVSVDEIESVSFPDFDLLLLQLEIPLETVLRAAQRAHQNGVRVLLNPAPARPLPDDLLANVDFLIPNESELSLLTGLPVTDLASADAAARQLLQRGVPMVIVTLGEKGALIVEPQRARHIPAFVVKAIDTTAAGDAFIGGLASALQRDLSLDDAVRFANACGALATTRLGAQPSLPRREEVEAFLAANKT